MTDPTRATVEPIQYRRIALLAVLDSCCFRTGSEARRVAEVVVVVSVARRRQKLQPAPAALLGEEDARQRRLRDDCEVDALVDMPRGTVETIEKMRAARTRPLPLRSEDETVDRKRILALVQPADNLTRFRSRPPPRKHGPPEFRRPPAMPGAGPPRARPGGAAPSPAQAGHCVRPAAAHSHWDRPHGGQRRPSRRDGNERECSTASRARPGEGVGVWWDWLERATSISLTTMPARSVSHAHQGPRWVLSG